MSERRLGILALRPAFRAMANAVSSSDGSPPSGASDDDLAKINAMTHRVLVPRTTDNCFVRYADVINDQPLKNGYCLRPEGVAAISRLIYDTGVQPNHDTGDGFNGGGLSALPLGRCFAGEMVMDNGVCVTRAGFTFPRTALTTELVGRMDGGAISELSAQFFYDRLTCSICGGDPEQFGHEHRPGSMVDGKMALAFIEGPDEYLETSLVWMGMANDTRLRLAAKRFGTEGPDAPEETPESEGDPFLQIVLAEERQREAIRAMFGPTGDELVEALLGPAR
jgi:hypothetical protein